MEELGDMAYATPNSLYFDQGKYYVEIVAAATTDRLRAAMRQYWQKFAAAVDVGKSRLSSELALFPTDGLRQGSISRSDPGEFGIEGFDNVYTAVYSVDGVEVTAFLSRRQSAEEATRLASAYQKLFEQFGGKSRPAGDDIPGGVAIEILGTHKIVFARGTVVAGVHESPSREAAHKVGLLLESTPFGGPTLMNARADDRINRREFALRSLRAGAAVAATAGVACWLHDPRWPRGAVRPAERSVVARLFRRRPLSAR